MTMMLLGLTDELAAGPTADAAFALAVQRLAAADEERREWLKRHCAKPDPDENPALDVRVCLVCSAPIPRPRGQGSGKWGKVCHACSEAGWRPAPCPSCGGPTNIRDRSSKKNMGTLYGMCRKCRAVMHREAA